MGGIPIPGEGTQSYVGIPQPQGVPHYQDRGTPSQDRTGVPPGQDWGTPLSGPRQGVLQNRGTPSSKDRTEVTPQPGQDWGTALVRIRLEYPSQDRIGVLLGQDWGHPPGTGYAWGVTPRAVRLVWFPQEDCPV